MPKHLVTRETLSDLIDRILRDPDEPLGLDTETTGLSPASDHVVGIGVSCSNRHGVYIPLDHKLVLEKRPKTVQSKNRKGEIVEKEVKKKGEVQYEVVDEDDHPANLTYQEVDLVMRAIAESGRTVVFHNAAFDLTMLRRSGWEVTNPIGDTMILKWLTLRGVIPKGKGRLGLKKLASSELGVKMTEYTDVDFQGIGFQYADLEIAAEYGADDPKRTLQLHSKLQKKLAAIDEEYGDNLLYEYESLEVPVIRVVSHMQDQGMYVDVSHLEQCHETLLAEQTSVQEKLNDLIEGEFPTTSTQKVSRMMFDHLKWWDPKGMERGKQLSKNDGMGFYSTNEATLRQQLKVGTREGRKVALLMLRFRKLNAILTRYCMTLAEKVDDDGRLRAGFFQVGTDTGRFSSSNPNMQNIPRPADNNHPDVWVRHMPTIRNAFVAAPGRRLLDIDYSQIELRLMAHFSKDPLLLKCYQEGLDVHQMTADEVGCSRQDAKPINFGLCIAEGQRVLTQEGLVPIEDVQDWHLVWDGVEWVGHEGVVNMGVKEVITFDGLTATPDHKVYMEDGSCVRFREAASTLRFGRIATGGVGQTPVRYAAFDRRCGEEEAQSQIRRGALRGLLSGSLDLGGQSAIRQDEDVRMYADAEVRRGPSRGDLGAALRRHGAALREGYARVLEAVQGAGHQGALQFAGGLHPLGLGNLPRRGLQRASVRPDRQRRSLLAGEPASDDVLGEQPQPKLTPVYDIMNAGPRHRFTVEGKVVSNCYGMSPWRLAQALDTDVEKAEHYHRRYFNAYRGVRIFHRATEKRVLKTGYVKTITGRHRRIEHLDPSNPGKYGHAIRQAINTRIQGSAADLMKIAMRNVWDRFEKEGVLGKKFWILSTVHDELICEADADFAETAAEWMKHEFETAVQLRVPLVADPQIGEKWGEIH